MNQILNMILRQVMRQLINRGVKAGFNQLDKGRGRKGSGAGAPRR